MTIVHEPGLLANMAASRETRVAVGVLSVVVSVMFALAAFAAGAVHATETRFESIEARSASIEKMIAAVQGADDERRQRDEMTRRDVFEQLVELRTMQQAAGVMLLDVRDDVRAIRDAVAPLPRAKE